MRCSFNKMALHVAGLLFTLGVFASARSQDTIRLLPEPKVTMGTWNRVFSNQVTGLKTFIYRLQGSATWDTAAGMGDPSEYYKDFFGLLHGKTYEYRVLMNGQLSNIVSSTQDARPPVVFDNLKRVFVRWNPVPVAFSAVDSVSGSVKRVVLYMRPGHNVSAPWDSVAQVLYPGGRVASPATPLIDTVYYQVPPGIGDGPFEFYLAAQDTAWNPVHLPGSAFSGSEGNFAAPPDTAQALIQIFLDTHQPRSLLKNGMNRYVNQQTFAVSYAASDSFAGRENFLGSGVREIRLYTGYKMEPGAAFYLYRDSLFARTLLLTPLISAEGVFQISVNKDGYYEFYSLAKDSAGNWENNGQPKTDVSYLLVDSSPPRLDSLQVQEYGDTTGHPAKPGWTKLPTVLVQLYGIEDVPKDGYFSGIDSICIAEDNLLVKNRYCEVALAGDKSVVYTLSTTAGAKTLYAVAKDKAVNLSLPVSQQIVYDPIAPQVDRFQVLSRATARDQVPVSVHVSDNGVLDSLYIWVDDVQVARSSLQGQSFSDTISVDLPAAQGWHVVKIQVRDRAGNVSTAAEDSVLKTFQAVLVNLKVFDLTDSTRSFFRAAPSYTDNPLVGVAVTFRGILQAFEISEQTSFANSVRFQRPFQIIRATATDTTVFVTFALSQEEGWKTLFVRGFGPELSDTTAVLSERIRLDLTAPVLSGIRAYRVIGPQDTTFDHFNSRDIRLSLNVSSGDLFAVMVQEESQDSVLIPAGIWMADTISYHLKTPDDGPILLHVSVRDSAGNWSNPVNRTVYLDRRLPQIKSFGFLAPYVSHFTPEVAVTCYDDTSFSAVGALDRIEFSENQAFDPAGTIVFDLPDRAIFSGNFQIPLTPVYGVHTLYVRVRDRAGNYSDVAQAQVEVVQVVSPVTVRIADPTDPQDVRMAAFPGWTNDDSVRVEIAYRGVLKKILVSADSLFESDVSVYDRWTAVNDSTALVYYSIAGKSGRQTIYIRLIGPNEPDSSQVISGAIQVDRTPPTVGAFQLFQVHAGGDTTFRYVNQVDIQGQVLGASESLSWLETWEDPQNRFFRPYQKVFGLSLTQGEGIKRVYLAVRDSAGNWSPPFAASVVLDQSAPVLGRVILSDVDIAGPADSSLTDDLRVEISLTASDAPPGALFGVRVAQDPSFQKNVAFVPFSSAGVRYENGYYHFTYVAKKEWLQQGRIFCWVAAVDSARNLSASLSDGIFYSSALRIELTLYDPADPQDSLYSGSNRVLLKVRPVSGFYEEISISPVPGQFADWSPVPPTEIYHGEYIFSSEKSFFTGRLYAAARNSAGQMAVDSAQIIIDRVAPQIVSVVIEAYTPPGNREVTYKQHVSVVVQAQDTGSIHEIQVTEDSTFRTKSRTIFDPPGASRVTDQTDLELSPGNGLKRIYARVLDFAGNYSSVVTAQILADYDPVGKITNHPNPFNPLREKTEIVVKTDGQTDIVVKIFDLFGNLVREFRRNRGEVYNRILWDGRNQNGEVVANGGYICVIQLDNRVYKRKIAVIK